jgi:hypothetical protein
MTDASYDTDLYAWTRAQAAALRDKRWEALDIEHLAEEIESLGSEQEHALESHLTILLLHLLKWHYQPARRGRSWRTSILLARQRIARRLRRSPGLRPELPTLTDTAYADARKVAASQTDLPLTTFPATCPWTPEQLQDEAFLPETEEGRTT